MDKNSLKWWQVPAMGLLYLVFVFASCFIGFLHPVCWAYFSVLAALVAAGPYFWLAARWQKFGVGTFLALLVCLFCLLSGEGGGTLSKVVILGGGILSDLVRLVVGNASIKGVRTAYPLLAIGNIGWIISLWTRPEWYYEGAIEEMGAAYADGITALQTTGHLIAVIALTALVAVLAIALCRKADKKSNEMLEG
ncbi:MAG: MptD family putative ECF transporter S component [Bacteroidales bacterium]|nr:MptD family putative ECF transporter S component [Bacteroidales bacterium]